MAKRWSSPPESWPGSRFRIPRSSRTSRILSQALGRWFLASKLVNLLGTAFQTSRNVVDILGLDDCSKVIFKKLCEIVLEFTTSKVNKDIIPRRRVFKFTQVWLFLIWKNSKSCGFANTVCSNQTKNLTRTRSGESVKLERVCWISMCDLGFKICRQVDDLNSTKGTFLTQIPQPIQRFSEMKAILLVGVTSIQSLPVLTTGHAFRHSCRHFWFTLVFADDCDSIWK